MEKRKKENNWELYKNKQVRLIIDDSDHTTKAKDGVFISCDETHIFLLLDGRELPTPFLRTTIRRIDL